MIQYLRIMLAPYLPDRDEERGASAVEYGLLLAGIAAIVILAVALLGPAIGDLFRGTADSVDTPPAVDLGS